MNNLTSTPERKDDDGLMVTVARGLTKEPAYLLIFAVCLLMFGGGTGLFISKGDVRSQSIAAAMFVAALVGAYATIRRIAPAHPAPAAAPSALQVERRRTSTPVAEIKDPELESALREITGNLRSASAIQHPVFVKFIRDRTAGFGVVTDSWARGAFKVERDAGGVLVDIYKSAQKSVFATSVPEYLEFWQSELGEQILKAHERSRAPVDRVFIFNDASEIDQNACEILKRQDRMKSVSVRVFLHSHVPSSVFSPTVSKDFTIIDAGEIIGVTDTFIGGDSIANWYFNDRVRGVQLRGIRDELIEHSIPLQTFLETHSPA